MSHGSFTPSPSEQNPYRSPDFYPSASPSGAGFQVSREPPTYAKVMVIIDLILCVLRGLGGFCTGILLLGVAVLPQQGFQQGFGERLPPSPVAYLELVATLGIVVAGLAANIGLLQKRTWGVTWGYIASAITLLSIVMGIGETLIQLPTIRQRFPGMEGFTIFTTAISVAIRLSLLAMYVVAVLQYARYLREAGDSRSVGAMR